MATSKKYLYTHVETCELWFQTLLGEQDHWGIQEAHRCTHPPQVCAGSLEVREQGPLVAVQTREEPTGTIASWRQLSFVNFLKFNSIITQSSTCCEFCSLPDDYKGSIGLLCLPYCYNLCCTNPYMSTGPWDEVNGLYPRTAQGPVTLWWSSLVMAGGCAH